MLQAVGEPISIDTGDSGPGIWSRDGQVRCQGRAGLQMDTVKMVWGGRRVEL